jgi:hypothetical protein
MATASIYVFDEKMQMKIIIAKRGENGRLSVFIYVLLWYEKKSNNMVGNIGCSAYFGRIYSTV